MKVTLGTFARSWIEAFIGGDVATGAQAALLHYTRRLRSDLQPVRLPRFGSEMQRRADTVFEVPLDPEVERSLRREVRRQGTSIERLTQHAVLVYLADLDRTLGRGAAAEPAQFL